MNAALPEAAAVGEIAVSAGAGLITLKDVALDVPPSGLGLVTVTLAVPVLVRSEAGTWAVRLVALTNVVLRALPFHCT